MIVAIPAKDEADRIERCLAALAMQRDVTAEPLPDGSFEVVVFANNCRDDTAERAQDLARISPHPIHVVAERLPQSHANAGWARKRAMDLAADRLSSAGRSDGIVLTTDADSVAAPTWIAATMRALAQGADCVAGYIDADPSEIMRLGQAFVGRGRLEDRYLRAIAEVYAICDPRPHDPWPNHRVSSGASLAITLAAYRAVGGLPPRAVGEDVALTQAVDRAGLRVRHALDVCVFTSCRLDGRASGGAADTMRYRQAIADAPCDDDMEPILPLLRRALCKGRLRRAFARGERDGGGWARPLGLSRAIAAALVERHATFEDAWLAVCETSPVLRARRTLRPSELPHQIGLAAICLAMLRGTALRVRTAASADSLRPQASPEPVAA